MYSGSRLMRVLPVFEMLCPTNQFPSPGRNILLLLYHNDWIDQELSASHAQITYLGQIFGGDLVSVRFP